jgi:hypothetical protein
MGQVMALMIALELAHEALCRKQKIYKGASEL